MAVSGLSFAHIVQDPEDDPDPETDPESDPETEPETDPESESETETETDPENEPESVPESESKTTTVTPPTSTTPKDCNIYYRDYEWALQDCVCRCFQNGCLMKIENDQRISDGKTPLVPVSEDLCRSFINKKCSVGFPVVAEFPIPAPCGCNRLPGSIATERFYSLCHLLKYSSENKKPFLTYSYCWPI
ncbi:salivary glue protein Sgs-5-like [Drosophila subpulchrella]|uniref:salivary glue protein Sgs-5-like n=1 Tax=Drosophila subpulchrella TaxID=1486046 RepID=UPI0018A12E12|nr:salivary glue protein Sgs-5-like [Drosophila subpulchrella]